MAVRHGRAGSVMHAYNDNDGLPAAADHGLLTELLRDQWGFEGTVVADYFGITFLHSLPAVPPPAAVAGPPPRSPGVVAERPPVPASAANLWPGAEPGRVTE